MKPRSCLNVKFRWTMIRTLTGSANPLSTTDESRVGEVWARDALGFPLVTKTLPERTRSTNSAATKGPNRHSESRKCCMYTRLIRPCVPSTDAASLGKVHHSRPCPPAEMWWQGILPLRPHTPLKEGRESLFSGGQTRAPNRAKTPTENKQSRKTKEQKGPTLVSAGKTQPRSTKNKG